VSIQPIDSNHPTIGIRPIKPWRLILVNQSESRVGSEIASPKVSRVAGHAVALALGIQL